MVNSIKLFLNDANEERFETIFFWKKFGGNAASSTSDDRKKSSDGWKNLSDDWKTPEKISDDNSIWWLKHLMIDKQIWWLKHLTIEASDYWSIWLLKHLMDEASDYCYHDYWSLTVVGLIEMRHVSVFFFIFILHLPL